MEIILGLLFTVIGVFLGWFLSEPHRLPNWIALNKKTNWKGIWYCAWFPKLPSENSWVIDKVTLSHKLGKLKIEATESVDGYNWEANLVIKDNYLMGEWKSKKPNSNSRDNLQLKVSNQGDILYGIATGPHIDNKLVTLKHLV